jgi:hypothetical protein
MLENAAQANDVRQDYAAPRSAIAVTGGGSMNNTPVLRLVTPQRVAGSDQVAPLQYSNTDTARLLGFSRRTDERLIGNRELASVGRGKLRRVPFDSIAAYQTRHRNDEVN